MKKALFILVLFSYSALTKGQEVPTNTTIAGADIDLYQLLDSIFSQLDKNSITTDLLLDKAVPLINIKDFTGQTDSDTLLSFYDWNDLYNTLLNTELTAGAGPPLADTWEPELEASAENGVIPFRSLHYDYHAGIEDSVQFYQLIYWDGAYFQDMEDRPNDPWVQHTVFAAGPTRQQLWDTLTAQFMVNSEYIFSNTGKSISTIEINFGNGEGYREISLNEEFLVSWPDTGDYLITWRTTYTDHSRYYSYSELKVGNTKKSAYSGYNFSPDVSDWEVYLTSGESQNLGINVQIEYGCGNHKLLKPFIFVEGWNPPSLLTNNKPRGNQYDNLWGKLTRYTREFPDHDPAHLDILDNLEGRGYDIIYIDFDEGAGDIIENALALEVVIDWVNAEKNKNGSNTPNVIWGESMGGLVTRVALRQMELENKDHDCSYYISFDNAHLGMNLPIGYQYMVKHVHYLAGKVLPNNYYVRDRVKDKTQAVMDLINMPATKQMLIYSAFNGTIMPGLNIEHFNFIAYLDQLGMPTQTTKNIAIANGNGAGSSQGFNSLAKLLDIKSNSFIAGNQYHRVKKILDQADEAYLDEYRSFFLGLWAAVQYSTIFNARFKVYAAPGYTSSSKTVYNGNLNLVVHGIRFPVYPREEKVSYFRPYDSGPASNWNINELSGGIASQLADVPGIDLNHNTFGFVPTVSALNIEDEIDNPYYSIPGEAQLVTQNKTTFDRVDVYQPASYLTSTAPDGNNEVHTTFTSSNIDVMNEVMFSSENTLNEQASSTLNARAYNFGRNETGSIIKETNDRISRTLTVSGTSATPGKICVNCADRIAFTDNSANPQTTTDHFGVLLTGNCDNGGSVLTIDNNGILEVGVDYNKTGRFTVHYGNVLKVKSGGVIRVRENSGLVIEEGAEFIFEDGAILDLEGYGSFAEFKGKIVVGENADFTYMGNGRFVFNQNVPIVDNTPVLDDFWDIGANATFTVKGPVSEDDQDGVIECYRSVYLKDRAGNTFTNVNVEDGKMSLHEGAMFFSYSPTTMRYVHVSTAYPWQEHGGIRVWNNPGQNLFWFCTFENGNPGLLLHWLGSSSPAAVTACNFVNCDVSMRVLDGPFKVVGSDFTNNTNSIIGTNLSGQSSIHSTDFSTSVVANGINLFGQAGSSLTIGGCILDGFDYALRAEGMEVRSYCTEYYNSNTLAIDMRNSSLDISEEARNKFTNNVSDIYFWGDDGANTGILLQNGYNDFEDRTTTPGYYIEGAVVNGPPLGYDPIPADFNKMNTYTDNTTGQPVMPVHITYGSSSTPITVLVPVVVDPNLPSVTGCNGGSGSGTGQSGSYAMVSGYPAEGGGISTANYPTGTLKAAALDAISKVTFDETVRQDDLALVRICEILEATVTSPDVYTERIRKALYLQMHKALNNAFQHGTLENTENEEPELGAIMEGVIAVIDHGLQNYNPNDASTYSAKFRYTLDKAHALRVAGYYDDALSLLGSPSGWTFTYEQQMRAGYWECACQVERDYFEEVISEEDYIEQKETCRQEYSGFTQKSAIAGNAGQYVHNVNRSLSEVYPQPVKEVLNLQITPGYTGIVKYDITDLAGRLIRTSASEWSGIRMSYDVQNLTTGVYFLKLYFGNQDMVVKFVKA